MDFSQKSNLIYYQLIEILNKKQSCVLTTVTSATGSTPQTPGSSAVFGRNGLLAGTIGGGATELAVAKIAKQRIHSKKSGYFNFDLNRKISDNNGPICGGGMNIFVDANPGIHFSVFEDIAHSLNNRQTGVLLTVFSQNESNPQLSREWFTAGKQEKLTALPFDLKNEISEMLTNPVSGDFREINLSLPESTDKKIAFLETVLPPPLLFIAGAGHIGKALAHIGNLLGFEVVVWDDRPEYVTSKNLQDASQTYSGEISHIKEKLAIGKDSFVVIVTHGHKNDSEVLKEFINEDVAYIGMMGSKRKVAQVRQMFLENEWATNEQWNRIHSPIGIEIGSRTVNEIAISIAAQLIQTRNGKKEID